MLTSTQVCYRARSRPNGKVGTAHHCAITTYSPHSQSWSESGFDIVGCISYRSTRFSRLLAPQDVTSHRLRYRTLLSRPVSFRQRRKTDRLQQAQFRRLAPRPPLQVPAIRRWTFLRARTPWPAPFRALRERLPPQFLLPSMDPSMHGRRQSKRSSGYMMMLGPEPSRRRIA